MFEGYDVKAVTNVDAKVARKKMLERVSVVVILVAIISGFLYFGGFRFISSFIHSKPSDVVSDEDIARSIRELNSKGNVPDVQISDEDISKSLKELNDSNPVPEQ